MRHVVRVLVLLVVGVIASLVGVVVSLTVTPPGRALLARNVSHQLETLLRGQVQVGNIDGSFLRDLVLRDVVVRDTAGVLLVSLPVVRVSYLIPNFLARRFILETLEVDHPVINLVRHSSGRWNYEEVLRLSEGPPGKTAPPLIEFRNMKLTDGALALAYPWPTGTMTDARARTAAAGGARSPRPHGGGDGGRHQAGHDVLEPDRGDHAGSASRRPTGSRCWWWWTRSVPTPASRRCRCGSCRASSSSRATRSASR